LFGVAPESDMRESDQSTLLKVYYRTYRRKSGRAYIELPFNHPRKIQRVAISTKLLTTKKQVRGLATKIKGHVGRLKAGWLAAWDRVKPTGGNMPPNWVWKHKSGAKGYFIDGLTSKDFPTFTIANTALGVTNKKNNVGWIVTNALNIRGKAMAKNLTLFMRGKKNLSDYAQGHARN
jgi:hypothetical protein